MDFISTVQYQLGKKCRKNALFINFYSTFTIDIGEIMLKWLIYTLNLCSSLLVWLMLGMVLVAVLWQDKKGKRRVVVVGRRMKIFILCLCSVFLLNLWLSSPLLNILFNVSIIFLSSYIFHRSSFHQFIKRKVATLIFSRLHRHSPNNKLFSQDDYYGEEEFDLNSAENTFDFPEEKIRIVHEKLDSPEFLYNPHVSLSLLSQRVSINSTYLSRYFNRQLGMSFPEYIMKHRLDKAEELLKNTDKKVLEILEEVGFQNSSTFYQAFNDRHGFSPLQWRKQVR